MKLTQKVLDPSTLENYQEPVKKVLMSTVMFIGDFISKEDIADHQAVKEGVTFLEILLSCVPEVDESGGKQNRWAWKAALELHRAGMEARCYLQENELWGDRDEVTTNLNLTSVSVLNKIMSQKVELEDLSVECEFLPKDAFLPLQQRMTQIVQQAAPTHLNNAMERCIGFLAGKFDPRNDQALEGEVTVFDCHAGAVSGELWSKKLAKSPKKAEVIQALEAHFRKDPEMFDNNVDMFCGLLEQVTVRRFYHHRRLAGHTV